MKAYTDYPLLDPATDNEVKEIDVLSYDRNKYVVVRYNDEEHEVKRGYIWKDSKLTKGFPTIAWTSLPSAPHEVKPTKIQANKERKQINRSKTTVYRVYANNKYKQYRNVLRALDAFSRASGDRYLNKFVIGHGWFSCSVPIEVTDGDLHYTNSLTKRHWRRVYCEIL